MSWSGCFTARTTKARCSKFNSIRNIGVTSVPTLPSSPTWVSLTSATGVSFTSALTRYGVEREAHDLGLDADGRRALRPTKARPVPDQLEAWPERKLTQVTEGSATAKAILCSLRRWAALTRYLGDGALPIDNKWLENLIRHIVLYPNNWLFAESARAGRRAAVVISFTQSARLNGNGPYLYLRDVLERLPVTPEHRLEELLPHRRKPANTSRLH